MSLLNAGEQKNGRKLFILALVSKSKQSIMGAPAQAQHDARNTEADGLNVIHLKAVLNLAAQRNDLFRFISLL